MDLADARHDQAVSLLTGIDRVVSLVIYREKFVPKGSSPPQSSSSTPSKVQRLPQITQPVISWNQTSPGAGGASLTLAQQPTSPGGSPSSASGVMASSGTPLTSPGPAFSAAVPTSYTHLGQASPTAGGTSPSATVNSSAMPLAESPKVIVPPKTLSSEWTTPPSAVQPPKFIYPSFSRPASTSLHATTTATTTTTTPSSISSISSAPATITTSAVGHSLSFAPTPFARTTENKEVILSPGQTVSVAASPSPYPNSVDSRVGVSDSLVSSGGQREQIKRLEFNHVQAASPSANSAVASSPTSPDVISPQPYPVEVSNLCVHTRVCVRACTCMLACVCLRVCVCAHERERLCACVCVCERE